MNQRMDAPSPVGGTLKAAVIRDDEAVFALLPPPGAEAFCAEVLPVDGPALRFDLTAPPPDQVGALTFRLPISADWPVLRQIALLVRIGDDWVYPPHDQQNCFLHRLLSTDLAEINDNLRWWKRISDLETRFFATRNSLRVIGGNFDLRARCIVAVGYQGIERDHAAILEWCLSEYAATGGRLDVTEDAEVRASIGIFWCHLAIAREDASMLMELSQALRRDVFAVSLPAIAAYNAVCLALLLGGWHLARGEKAAAAAFFAPTNGFFKTAALHYPRALVNYRELAAIAQKTYYCQIGRHMAEDLGV